MGYRENALRSRLKSYLDRRAMPNHLKDKPQAQIDEIDALLRAVLRTAPRDGFEEWWPKVADRMDEDRRYSTWPSVGDIASAARAVNGASGVRIADGTEIEPLRIFAGRMERGEAVPDGCVYGRLAVDMQREGLVDSDTLRRYRSQLYFKAKGVYGEDEARRMEVDWIARHEAAENDSGETVTRDLPKPSPQKMVTHDWDGAQ